MRWIVLGIAKFNKCLKTRFQISQKLISLNFFSTQTLQMIGINLTIDELVISVLDKADKTYFAGITYFGKHAFTTKHAIAQINAIQTTYQLFILPNLNRFCITQMMQFCVSI